MTNSERLVARRHAVAPRGVGQFAGDTTIAFARGSRIVDADGRELLDFAGGIGVVNGGHCPERVVSLTSKNGYKVNYGPFAPEIETDRRVPCAADLARQVHHEIALDSGHGRVLWPQRLSGRNLASAFVEVRRTVELNQISNSGDHAFSA